MDIVDEAEVAARARVEYSVAVADSSEQSLVGSRIDELASLSSASVLVSVLCSELELETSAGLGVSSEPS